jgi:hypothetical protein
MVDDVMGNLVDERDVAAEPLEYQSIDAVPVAGDQLSEGRQRVVS